MEWIQLKTEPRTETYLKENKGKEFYMYKDKKNGDKVIYLGEFLNRTAHGSSNNYYFIWEFTNGEVNTGEIPEVNLGIVFKFEPKTRSSKKGGGTRSTRLNKRSKKTKCRYY
jgi:hypothetical protein